MHGGARRVNADDIGRIDLVGGDASRHDLYLATEGLVEEGAHGPIDKSGDENLLVLGPCLAFDEAAGDLARGVILFVVFHRKRDEIQPSVTELSSRRWL